jgi:hypothetical protein
MRRHLLVTTRRQPTQSVRPDPLGEDDWVTVSHNKQTHHLIESETGQVWVVAGEEKPSNYKTAPDLAARLWRAATYWASLTSAAQ